MTDYPAAFLADMRQLLGGAYPAFLRALGEPATRALRLNPNKPIDWAGDAVPWEAAGRYAPVEFRPGRDLRHFAGAYYMQEACAMAPARALAPSPGETVLDLCAAPGGKAGQLAAMLNGRGVLVANEPDGARARALSGNLERLGASNAVVVSAPPEALSRAWPERFDKILVDAPCSGEGMMRRDEAARDQWRAAQAEGCARRQSRILREAAKLLKPGGHLAYSTCTFNQIENEGVVRAFLTEHPAFAPMEFALSGAPRSTGGMLRLWPHAVRGEGHFIALFQKGGASPRPENPPDAPRAAGDALAPFDALARLDRFLPGARPYAMGEQCYLLPNACPPLDGLRVLRAGLKIGTRAKGRALPDHALAMALAPGEARRAAALSEAEANAFVRGEALPFDGEPGFTLAHFQGLPLGWGKASDGLLKNHIPKGLRLP
jgi:16S rRNA C967 or C1407 C5-methylase (RsmB/RsmF family)/NOL1/NOP2/fmu family ribosome biogenesis protein